MKSVPLVSIITTSLNSDKFLEQTINSIISQSYKNLELIVIDGGSTDGTLDIIKKYENRIAFWVSERDKGISDAFNKGLLASKGDYINFQGSSDYLWSDTVIEEMMDQIDIDKDMLICGKVNRIDEESGDIIFTSGKVFKKWNLLYKMGLAHQALFTNKKFFDKYGLFDLNCKFAMDYELLLRAFNDFPEVKMKDIIVSFWRAGGIGRNRMPELLDEYRRIKMKHKIAPAPFLFLLDKIIRLRYLSQI
jgi:glycosyltransferase involved in cell wall biosynthesis